MRDIKFRGKPTQNNTSYFDDDDWVYGSLTIQKDKYYIVLEVIENIKRDDYAVYMIEVIPETIGQYTGLKDKNGKEIYEGDIINFDYIKERNYEIVFEDGTYWIRDKDNQYISLHEVVEICKRPNNWKVEVIGNIYDNSELLEEGE